MNINYAIPDNIHQALKVQAAREGVTLKELIIRWLTEKLEAEAPDWRIR